MKNIMSILIASLLCLAPLSCNGKKIDNSTVKSLDLDRYLGTWYEIARFDHSFERGLTHAQANYALKADGNIWTPQAASAYRSSALSTRITE